MKSPAMPRFSHWITTFLHPAGPAPEMLFNVTKVRSPVGRPRALLAYITRPFLLNPSSSEFLVHQNRWCALEIARLLGELGYVVDVIDWNSDHAKFEDSYDLLIGFGRAAEELAKELPDRAVKIFLATGSQANFANKRETERLDDVRRKRGCLLPPVRQSPDRAEYLQYFDAIACIGNQDVAATFRPYFRKKILTWNNHGYDHLSGIPKGKNFEEARHNFLYFSGSGQVLVGLDLVLEAFVQLPRLKLFVCGSFVHEKEFVKCFHKELYETPNIVPVGWVKVGTSQYFELIRKCGATIFPICAGASPGSVVLLMNHGIIPIVSKEAGIDTADFGLTLSSLSSDEIRKEVDWVSNQSADWHREAAIRVFEAARRDFSQTALTRQFHEILATEIQDKTGA